jgi:antitoxin component YwqK of YwqJK toxin-antitoxin module
MSMIVKLSVYWPDDWKSVILSKSEWEEILSGKSFSKDGEGYHYEGEKFSDWWSFQGGLDGGVEVTYDGGGVGFIGTLSDTEIRKEFYNGQLQGSRVLYDNGQLKKECHLKNGELHGLQREWYESGQLEVEENYENGELHGLQRRWYESGQLKKEMNYENGDIHGLQRSWFESGELVWEEKWENGVLIEQDGILIE